MSFWTRFSHRLVRRQGNGAGRRSEEEGLFRGVSQLQSPPSAVAFNSPMVACWPASLYHQCQQRERKKPSNCFLAGVKASFRALIGLCSQTGCCQHAAHGLPLSSCSSRPVQRLRIHNGFVFAPFPFSLSLLTCILGLYWPLYGNGSLPALFVTLYSKKIWHMRRS